VKENVHRKTFWKKSAITYPNPVTQHLVTPLGTQVGFHLIRSRRVVEDQQVGSLLWQVRQHVGARQGKESLLELRGCKGLGGDGREIIAVGDEIKEPG